MNLNYFYYIHFSLIILIISKKKIFHYSNSVDLNLESLLYIKPKFRSFNEENLNAGNEICSSPFPSFSSIFFRFELEKYLLQLFLLSLVSIKSINEGIFIFEKSIVCFLE